MKMPYQEVGNGEVVILLHAFPLSRKMWEPNIESLVELGCRVITPDLRGFGDNSNFADINLMEDIAMDVLELLDSLNIEKAFIGGLSMGGYITFNLYRLFPQRFRALILCDTSFKADTEEKRLGRFELIEKIEKLGSKALIENMLPNLISEYTKENNHELMSSLTEEFSKVEPQSAIAALRGMAERFDHTNLLNKIDVPTILIFGEDDKVTNLEVAEEMKSNIKNSRLEIIKNAGHYSNLENPNGFNSALTDFIQNNK